MGMNLATQGRARHRPAWIFFFVEGIDSGDWFMHKRSLRVGGLNHQKDESFWIIIPIRGKIRQTYQNMIYIYHIYNRYAPLAFRIMISGQGSSLSMWCWNPVVPVLATVPRVSLASSIHLSGKVPYSGTASIFFRFFLCGVAFNIFLCFHFSLSLHFRLLCGAVLPSMPVLVSFFVLAG